MLRNCICIKGAVVVGLIAALAPAVASLWANPSQEARAQRADAPVEAQAQPIGTPLAAGVCPGEGNCFDPDGNGTPGCNDLACCEAVCAADPFCCDVEWDSACADEAAELCGNPACPGEGSCFEANGTPGCDDPVCCNKICLIDPFCCDVEWDSACADEAADVCQGAPVCPGEGNCFDPDGNGTPGCNDLDCCEAVCAADPFCCDVEWDSACADGAAALCGNPACPGSGSCFVANGTPGCDDPVCCNKICLIDPFCCDVEWDSVCAGEAAKICAPPENDLCEDAIRVSVPGFAVGGTETATIDDEFPFCGTSITAPGVWYSVIGTGNTITATTCSEFTEYDTKISVYCFSCADPICVGGNDDDCDMFGGLHSTVTWCSQEGTEYLILVHGFGDLTGGFNLSVFDDGVPCDDPVDCAFGDVCGDPDAGNCFDPDGNGTPGCNDLACCQAVCAADPFCCNVEWDSICAGDAADLCGNPACPGEGSCFEANGTPGCDDPVCCNKICLIDPFCCEFEWDSICAGEAADVCPPPCPADIDGSGDVGVKDLLFLLGAWGDCPAKGECLADFDGSGDVGVKDLLFLLGAWGDCL